MSQTVTLEAAPAIELRHINPKVHDHDDGDLGTARASSGHVLDPKAENGHGDRGVGETGVTGAESDDAPENAQREVERWNRPRNNVPKLAFVFLSFIISGMNDAAIGPLIPSVCPFVEMNQTGSHNADHTSSRNSTTSTTPSSPSFSLPPSRATPSPPSPTPASTCASASAASPSWRPSATSSPTWP